MSGEIKRRSDRERLNFLFGQSQNVNMITKVQVDTRDEAARISDNLIIIHYKSKYKHSF